MNATRQAVQGDRPTKIIERDLFSNNIGDINLITLLPIGGRYSLYENTFVRALDNLCGDLNLYYEMSLPCVSYNKIEENVLKVEPSDAPTLFFIQWDDWFENDSYAELKKRRPNSKIVLFSADTIYLRHRYRLTPDLIDLHIDTLSSECEFVRDHFGIPTRRIYWTISEDTIKHIASKIRGTVPKLYDGISLCRQYPDHQYMDRTKFFKYLGNKNTIVTGIDETDLTKIYGLYAQSWVSVGTSTSTITTHPITRSAKGYRDWMAPFCGCLLIYDDHPDLNDIKCLPKYQYMNVRQCSDLIEHFKKSTQYPILLEEQREWARANTLEKQLKDVFLNDLHGDF